MGDTVWTAQSPDSGVIPDASSPSGDTGPTWTETGAETDGGSAPLNVIERGGLLYKTKALMDADLAHDDGSPAYVYADTDENNGAYVKNGNTGTGSWTFAISITATMAYALAAQVAAEAAAASEANADADATATAADRVQTGLDRTAADASATAAATSASSVSSSSSAIRTIQQQTGARFIFDQTDTPVLAKLGGSGAASDAAWTQTAGYVQGSVASNKNSATNYLRSMPQFVQRAGKTRMKLEMLWQATTGGFPVPVMGFATPNSATAAKIGIGIKSDGTLQQVLANGTFGTALASGGAAMVVGSVCSIDFTDNGDGTGQINAASSNGTPLTIPAPIPISGLSTPFDRFDTANDATAEPYWWFMMRDHATIRFTLTVWDGTGAQTKADISQAKDEAVAKAQSLVSLGDILQAGSSEAATFYAQFALNMPSGFTLAPPLYAYKAIPSGGGYVFTTDMSLIVDFTEFDDDVDNFYVRPSGIDSASGIEAAPFASGAFALFTGTKAKKIINFDLSEEYFYDNSFRASTLNAQCKQLWIRRWPGTTGDNHISQKENVTLTWVDDTTGTNTFTTAYAQTIVGVVDWGTILYTYVDFFGHSIPVPRRPKAQTSAANVRLNGGAGTNGAFFSNGTNIWYQKPDGSMPTSDDKIYRNTGGFGFDVDGGELFIQDVTFDGSRGHTMRNSVGTMDTLIKLQNFRSLNSAGALPNSTDMITLNGRVVCSIYNSTGINSDRDIWNWSALNGHSGIAYVALSAGINAGNLQTTVNNSDNAWTGHDAFQGIFLGTLGYDSQGSNFGFGDTANIMLLRTAAGGSRATGDPCNNYQAGADTTHAVNMWLNNPISVVDGLVTAGASAYDVTVDGGSSVIKYANAGTWGVSGTSTPLADPLNGGTVTTYLP